MLKAYSRQSAFTIVEFLVVIVVIGILAAITIVSYTGITSRATVASLTSDLDGASKLLKLDQITNGVYPATLAEANSNKGILSSPGTTYQYIVNNSLNPPGFCMTATKSGTSYKITENTSPTIGDCTTYGLVLNLDAGNTASYPSPFNGTTWIDLSGIGNNGSLLNGVGYSSANSGVLTFDGVDDYGTIPYSDNLSLSKFTLGSWAKPIGLQVEGASILSDSYPSKVNYSLSFATNTLNIMGGIYLGGWYHTNTATLTDGAWAYIVATYDGAYLNLYTNGSLVGAPTAVAINPSASGTPIKIGRRWDYPDYFKGSIANITLYNRSLSLIEISQNFNATKDRYGL